MTRWNEIVGALCAVTLVGLSGCKSSDLPDLQGRFEGTQTTQGKLQQVVTQIPSFTPTGDASGGAFALQFKVYPTLSISQPSALGISYSSPGLVQISLPGITPSDTALARTGDCAKGSNGALDLNFCWAVGKVDLDVVDRGSTQTVYALHVVRDDNLPSLPSGSGVHAYTLEELLGRVKFLGYSVTQDAEKVFQAKATIQIAEGNLLPHLNFGAILGLALGERSSGYQAIGSVLPFIFPSNWYRWKEAKELYQAERVSFSNLRGNEMNAAEGLLYAIHRDQASFDLLKSHIAWLQGIQKGLAAEEANQTLPAGTADYFGTSVLKLRQDQIELESFIATEKAALAQGVALPPVSPAFELAPLPEPDLSTVQTVNATDFVKDAAAKSFEIKTLGFLVDASRNATGEVTFGFLDPEGGGSLGFGQASQVRVARSQTEILRQKVAETASLLEQRCVEVASEFNSALRQSRLADAMITSLEKRFRWLMLRHINGDSTLSETDFMEQLLDLQGQILASKADRLSYIRNWMIAKSKLDRLLVQGNYSQLDQALPGEENKVDSQSGSGPSSNLL